MIRLLSIFPLWLLIMGLLSSGCELTSSTESLDDEDPQPDGQTIDCGPTDLRRPNRSDTSGNLYYLTGMTIIPYDRELVVNPVTGDTITNTFPSAVLRHALDFWIQAKHQRLDSAEVLAQYPNLKLEDAIRVGQYGWILNPHDFDVSFRVDKDYEYHGTTISAGTDLMDRFVLPVTRYETQGLSSPWTLSPFAIHRLVLNPKIFSFSPDCYEFRYGFQAKDGSEIWDTVRVFIDYAGEL